MNRETRRGAVKPGIRFLLACAALALGLQAGMAHAGRPGGGGGGSPKNQPPTCTIDSPMSDVTIAVGGTVPYTGTATDADGSIASYTWKFGGGSPTTSSEQDPGNVTYATAGVYTTTFSATDDKGAVCTQQIRTITVTSTPPPPPPQSSSYSILAANDLGMHCADLDYQVFSILPPFNVVHAQVVKQGTGTTSTTLPKLLTNADVGVVYSAVSSDLDPVGIGSMNTTSDSMYLDFSKTNFWDKLPTNANRTIGAEAYRELYPSTAALGLCTSVPCPSVLDWTDLNQLVNGIDPLKVDTGIPVPDPVHLPNLVAGQQHMPGLTNDPQPFDRFDADVPFFADFPFGFTVTGANWFAADGVPILPIDDDGRDNAYPLMRVEAVAANDNGLGEPAGTVLASLDVVVPVASEADCQSCHADPTDFGNGSATFNPSKLFTVVLADDAPGITPLNRLQNAAKINILRLHDAKHGASYKSWQYTGAGPTLVAAICDGTSGDLDCLDNQRPVQCSQCHYSPALDLAQAGPVDEPEQGPRGRQQRHHISQSRAMHEHHGEFTDLFPEMPAPTDSQRTYEQTLNPVNAFELGILEDTCYQCHPGKNTKCLRGAMFQGGMVCQDCHGNMKEVGNDFTEKFATNPYPAGADLTKRVSWANEPACQSCHTGDAVTNKTGSYPSLKAPDGIRLLQAYTSKTHTDGTPVAEVIKSPTSRFAENRSLYRLSQGHGGVKCEGCHGSTHAEWPVTPREGPFVANDNLAARQLQGHDGKIQECDVCHQRDADGNLSMPLGLDGPHGMHPVNDKRWNHQHRNFTGGQFANCRGCHGTNLTGTVLSATSTDRILDCKTTAGSFPDCRKGSPTAFVPAGTQIGCGNCHKQK
jgi:PKD repeat protein